MPLAMECELAPLDLAETRCAAFLGDLSDQGGGKRSRRRSARRFPIALGQRHPGNFLHIHGRTGLLQNLGGGIQAAQVFFLRLLRSASPLGLACLFGSLRLVALGTIAILVGLSSTAVGASDRFQLGMGRVFDRGQRSLYRLGLRRNRGILTTLADSGFGNRPQHAGVFDPRLFTVGHVRAVPTAKTALGIDPHLNQPFRDFRNIHAADLHIAFLDHRTPPAECKNQMLKLSFVAAADFICRPQGQGNLFHIEFVEVEAVRTPAFQRRNVQHLLGDLFHLFGNLFADKFSLEELAQQPKCFLFVKGMRFPPFIELLFSGIVAAKHISVAAVVIPVQQGHHVVNQFNVKVSLHAISRRFGLGFVDQVGQVSGQKIDDLAGIFRAGLDIPTAIEVGHRLSTGNLWDPEFRDPACVQLVVGKRQCLKVIAVDGSASAAASGSAGFSGDDQVIADRTGFCDRFYVWSPWFVEMWYSLVHHTGAIVSQKHQGEGAWLQ